MIVASSYHILVFVIGLSLIAAGPDEMYSGKPKIVDEAEIKKLGMDEAYLIMNNMNNSNTSILLGNSIICEGCDLEEMVTVSPYSTVTLIITTQYAYDLEIRSLPSEALLQCHVTSYKFAEHGTYLFEVKQSAEDGVEACSIVEIGAPSHYWSPIIVGLVVWIILIAIIELCCYLSHNCYFDKFVANILKQRLAKDDGETLPLVSPLASSENLKQPEYNASHSEVNGNLPIRQPNQLSNKTIDSSLVKSKRFQALDALRGLALMMMIFVSYGGGGYWFFRHAVWNGLNLADIPFPWFVWLIGFSIVLSQRSLRARKVSKRSKLFKICRRTFILFLLGLTDESKLRPLKNLEILGVLQRLALCYFFTALIVLFIGSSDDEPNTTRSTIGGQIKRHWRSDLFNSVFRFWLQWLCIILITTVWLLITFLLDVPGCPKGYLGPGGKHDHGKYQNCTGGAARYIDQLILTDSHMGLCWTCRRIYNTFLSFEAEGSLGVLTGILLCYISVQAGHSYVHTTSVFRRCTHWLISAIICGSLGLLLSNGGDSNGWIPINKNLWSLSFVLIDASLALIILIIFYLVFDIGQWSTGAPFRWLGMNSIVIYMAYKIYREHFPVQFDVEKTHAKQMALQLYGVFFWLLIAGLMYRKKLFIIV